MDESSTNNHDEQSEPQQLDYGWKDYLSMSAAELLGWKQYMSTSEAELEWKNPSLPLTLEQLLEWKKFVPIGYRFVPSGRELLKYYLLAKVHGGFNLPGAGLGIIREVDVYQSHPATLPGLDKGEESCYFFTTRDLWNKNSERTARITKDGRGHWRVTSKITPLFEADGSKLGRKNTLVYHLTKPPGVTSKKDLKTNWIMHEYVLDKSLYDYSKIPPASVKKAKPVVLCRIYERDKKGTGQEESQTEGSTSLRTRYTDNSSAGVERKENHTKRKQLPTSTPETGTSSCNHRKSVAQFDQEKLPFSQPKRSRLLKVEQDESRMHCKEENGHEENSRDQEEEEEDVQLRIGCIEDTESGHLMASVNQDEKEEEEESQITTMNGHIKERNESSRELHPANARTEEIRQPPEIVSTVLTSPPSIQRHSSGDVSSDRSFIHGEWRY